VVAGVWAVAATAIAVLAFLAANDDDAQQLSDSTNRARRVERRLHAQVDQLEARLAKVPESSDVQDLEKRLGHVEKVAARQDRQLVSIGKQLEAIRPRVDAVEKTANDALQKAENTTTTP
jgi:chromosome segregation ATPase